MRRLLSPDELCAREALRQHGLITVAQAIAYGLTIHQVRHRLRSGRWERVAPGVFRIAGVPASTRQDEWCAHLWAGGCGALILGAAARVWGFRGFGADPVELAIAGEGTRDHLPFVVHRYGRDSLIHTTTVDGLRVSSIPKTVMDLLGQRDRRAEWALDRSLIDRRCTLGEYWLLHDDPEMRGHRGRALLRERLEVRGVRPPNESTGERKLWRLMHSAPDFRLPDRQYWLTFPEANASGTTSRTTTSCSP